jgi:hypothetical protein
MIYSETIYMRKTWIMVMVLLSMFTAIALSGKEVFASGGSPDYSSLVFIVIIEFLVLALIWSIRLRFTIEKAGLYYRYFPFHFREYFIPWETVMAAGGRNYSPLTEYGGWGIKGSKKNRAYNVSGSFGLQLELIEGRKILFESNNPDEISKMLDKVREIYPKIQSISA